MVSLHKTIEFSDDDEEAFLQFEEEARDAMNHTVWHLGQNEGETEARLTFMGRVKEAAKEYGIDGANDLPIPTPYKPEHFDAFNHAVVRMTTRLKIRIARRVKGEVLQPTTSEREKIKFRVDQLRAEVEGANDLPTGRKAAILKTLDDLVREFEGTKTSRAKVLVILTALATLVNQSQGILIKGPQTVVAVMDSINLLIGNEDERRALLDRYRKPLEIEDHSKSDEPQGGISSGPREEFSADLDDEIPF